MKNPLLTIICSALIASAFATEDCPPESASPAAQLQETLVNQNNNTCPSRSYTNHFNNAQTIGEVRTIFDSKLKDLGLDADWSAGTEGSGRWDTFTDADLARAKRLSNITLHALALYPPGSFRKIGLRKIRMVKDFKYTSNGVDQSRMAMPSPRTDTLLYAENNDITCEAGIELRMHHELFHLLEGTVHGNMFHRDRNWAKINPPNFTYQNGGTLAYGASGFQNLEHPSSGFVSEYAQFGEEEDRSDTFAMMMTAGYSDRMSGWNSVDPTLARKKEYIQNFMKKKISPTMDEAFFNRINSTR